MVPCSVYPLFKVKKYVVNISTVLFRTASNWYFHCYKTISLSHLPYRSTFYQFAKYLYSDHHYLSKVKNNKGTKQERIYKAE